VDPARQHLDNGTVLERRGLLNEAEAQYLSAMTTRDPAIRQQAEEGLARTHGQQEQRLVQVDLDLGKALEEAHELDRALTIYERAFRESKGEEHETARQAVLRVLEARGSFCEGYVRTWLKPWATKFLIGLLGLFVFYLFLKLLYKILKGAGGWIGSRSNRIEVADFEDSSETGLGKGFPAVLRTVYRDRQVLAQPSSASYGGPALAFRPGQSNLPVMGSATYETFSEIKLELAGIEVSELLSRVEKLLFRPRYLVGGCIYRYGHEMRADVTLSKYNIREMARWDFGLAAQRGGFTTLTDPMYEIIDAILRDWNAEHTRPRLLPRS